MSKAKKSIIEVQGSSISILSQQGEDYISLTDMVRNFDGGGALIEQWLKNKDTVMFLGIWECINNPDFNSLEFEGIKNEAGRNSFFLSAKKWVELTEAKGLIASAGRYGGTFAHRDIAFEFGSWLSPEFKLYLIKEFQRLKEDENQRLSLAWNLNRTLSKLNYRIHTDAIKEQKGSQSVTNCHQLNDRWSPIGAIDGSRAIHPTDLVRLRHLTSSPLPTSPRWGEEQAPSPSGGGLGRGRV